PDPAHRTCAKIAASESSLRLGWLGTAGWIVRTSRATILIDPFVSRPSITRVAFRPLEPAPLERAPWLPQKIDAIVCGHSHYDHLLDAPLIARARGAKLVGSATTCAFGRASGVPESQLV